ncbi:hypothetical protein VTO73DRAFT_13322 [Trametes versicolor]
MDSTVFHCSTRHSASYHAKSSQDRSTRFERRLKLSDIPERPTNLCLGRSLFASATLPRPTSSGVTVLHTAPLVRSPPPSWWIHRLGWSALLVEQDLRPRSGRDCVFWRRRDVAPRNALAIVLVAMRRCNYATSSG